MGVAGIILFYRKEKVWVFSLLLIFLFQLWIVGSWREWWGSHSFGHRMFLTSAPLFIMGLCGFLEYLEQKLSSIHFQRIVVLGGTLLVLWNFGLMVQYAANLIDRDGTTPFTQVIQNQFTLVPQKVIHGLNQLFHHRFTS